MDFTRNGNIVIEDNIVDGEVLGHAVALGENDFADMRDASVDTSARTLTPEESRSAIHGLRRMANIDPHSQFAHNCVRNGGAVVRHAFNQHRHAVSYLERIALRAVSQPGEAPTEFMYS